MTERDSRQLGSIRQRLSELKAQQGKILAKNKEDQRKTRTRRLIQMGALAEKYFQLGGLELGEVEERLKAIVNIEAVKEILQSKTPKA
jgi:hypothetical protein